jgi:hypothetical protein
MSTMPRLAAGTSHAERTAAEPRNDVCTAFHDFKISTFVDAITNRNKSLCIE